ncbi:hypothetical protein HF521_017021 [Silurus meridionalis]|uniref:Uncharacterized protein n=1 Tax=Silurus meridionalis TaxID=175797 RepID=A0A8T0BLN4_SILME|nr:hypothetical protein HF521_017021 [Silurus meridionalis]
MAESQLLKNIGDVIAGVLLDLSDQLVKSVEDTLKTLGAASTDDLKNITENDLLPVLKPIQARRLVAAWTQNRGCFKNFSSEAQPEQVCFQLQSQTPVLTNRHRRDVHSSSSTAADETSTHRPLPPQTRRPLIVLYRRRRDVHSSSSTAADETSTHRPLPPQTRRPLIVLYRRRRDVHSSSSTAADETSTHRPLPPQTRRPLIVLYRRRRDVHSSSSTAADETSTHRPLPPQTRCPLIVL